MIKMGSERFFNYIVKGVEEVYDAFDEFEHNNPLDPIEVRAKDVDDAVAKGKEILQAKIDEYRREGGYMSKGMFIVHIIEVLDPGGNVLYKNDIRDNIL